ncbi:hypothetical protein [Pectobacterium wasabiae]|uniref:Glycosyltransferase n=1 Tax=Pectobacterium wasabiae TaxID=55208 RepID=A0AAW3EJ51_9GAMM|nr:hypothetical protein [Pectobacterium wasabiae]AOR64665.1 hypothetical protein A7983_15695 [Pectobacterium wasabiae CFBP 3304]EJS93429.1 WbsW [Pectobacterium wasabiae CFBP 3304]KFX08841.1 hypothetical protein JV38_03850 [Pectobacterium wasabiae]KGA28948.1 hypothetical protein KU73_07575 [Pectobacterium wasabiae]
MTYDICIICVLYSKQPIETATVKSLLENQHYLESKKVTLCFWDNSIQGFSASSLSNFTVPTEYYHTGVNTSLSEVYNKIISDIDASSYIIFDDDSDFSIEYFTCLDGFFQSDEKIACPIIYNGEHLISPGVVRGVRGAEITESCLKKSTGNPDLISIMSGTVIKKSVLDFIKFDERLSLYGIDTKFYLSAKKNKINIYILPYRMNHNSALHEVTDVENHIKRLIVMLKSKWVVFDDVPFYKIKLVLYISALSLYLSIKKDVRYIKLLKSISYFK